MKKMYWRKDKLVKTALILCAALALASCGQRISVQTAEFGAADGRLVHSTVITLNAAQGRDANRQIEELLSCGTGGYTLDDVNAYLEEAGIANAFVSIGGVLMLARGRNSRGHFWEIGLRNPLTPEIFSGVTQVSDRVVAVNYYAAEHDILGAVVIMDSAAEGSGETAEALAAALLTTNRQGAVEFHMGGQFDFEMILFVENADAPNSRGYDVLHTSVIFEPAR